MAEELPSGAVTLLLADLEGSVGLWERDAEPMQAAMGRVDELVAGHIDTHHGVCPAEQGKGDSFVLAFPRASDAVACARAELAAEAARRDVQGHHPTG